MGSALLWGINGSGAWNTGTNWDTALLTGGSLSYQAGGLQVASLTFNDTPGTVAPGPGSSVTIAPPSAATQNVAVTGPPASASVGALTIYGANGHNAALALSSSGSLVATSVSVLAGGFLGDDGGAGSGSLVTPVLAISGGSVGLGNAATSVGAVTINTGGVLNLSGGSVGSAAIASGLLNAIGGSIATLSASGGNTTITVPATFGAATVSGTAVVNLINTNTMSSLTVSGGTVSTSINTITAALVNGGTFNPQNSTIAAFTHSSGVTTFGSYVTIGTADVSAGMGTVNAVNPVTIQSMLKLPGGVTATVGGSSFNVSGANLANNTQPSTLTLFGGVLTITPSGAGALLGQAINVFVPGNGSGLTYTGTSGAGVTPDTGTVWNSPPVGTVTALQNSVGAATGVTYLAGTNTNNFFTGAYNPNMVLNVIADQRPVGTPMTFTFGGLSLSSSVQYDLYAIMDCNTAGRATSFTVGNTTQTVTTPANFATVTLSPTSTGIYTEFTNLSATGTGQIVVTCTSPAGLGTEEDVNGFELVPVAASVVLNLPNTNIVATANSILDFGNAATFVTLGGLSLAGSVTVQDVYNFGAACSSAAT